MTQPHELTLDVGGLSVAARRWGTVGTKPVLALHGWLDNAASFDRLAPLLPGVDLVAMDLPGHGRSQHRPIGATYHFVDWLVDVDRVLDALGWSTATLLGHSLGAAIASVYAGALPERVEGLIAIDGLGPMSDDESAAPERLRDHLIERRRAARRRPTVFADVPAAARRLCQVAAGLSQDSAEILSARGTAPCDGGVVWRADPRLRGRSAWRSSEAQVHALLQAVRCPTLLVWARQGYPFDVAQMQARAALIAGLETLEVDGSHHVHLDAPERLVERVRAFLARDAD
ncbi:MAG: alpha/beta hydrolase [Myxococcota bacterium]